MKTKHIRWVVESIVILFCLLFLICMANKQAAGLQGPAKDEYLQFNLIEEDLTFKTKVYIGTYKVTAYCPCEVCCDEYAINRPLNKDGKEIVYTASGEIAKEGITVAASKSIPFGTELYIDGHAFTVQDRGSAVTENCIDIYFESHEKAKEWGVQYKDVYKEVVL